MNNSPLALMKQSAEKVLAVLENGLETEESLTTFAKESEALFRQMDLLESVIGSVRQSQEKREEETVRNIESLISISKRRKAATNRLFAALRIRNAAKRLAALLRLESDLLCI